MYWVKLVNKTDMSKNAFNVENNNKNTKIKIKKQINYHKMKEYRSLWIIITWKKIKNGKNVKKRKAYLCFLKK
ncbi:hypothetical protein [Halothermothrix orenii]|uniref:hypothetical protein n=1 Tax=Halothermothrix orenii TaxID=31909 RepID=UPI0002E35145|nr:hypothetical protein [Halothermothrix orenii]